MTKVTRREEDSVRETRLHMAMELAEKKWKLAFTTGLGQKPRRRSVEAGDVEGVMREMERAGRRFGLGEWVRVVSCYEAGMEGFWLHRALEERGIENVVVDSASIDVKRGRRTAKTDRLDLGALLRKLVQYESGDRKVWSVVRVPPEEAEDLRHNDRELQRLGDERTAVGNGIRGLLKTQGIRLGRVRELPEQLKRVRTWKGEEIGSELRARLLRLWERLQLIEAQIKQVEERRGELVKQDTTVGEKARQLGRVRSLGETMSWRLAAEIVGWRPYQNRRQAGSLVGLVGVPYQSGEDSRDQGISKAGRTRLRASLIELAWLWLRYQPNSEVAHWFERRYARGSKRLRRIGIVAVARRILIDLWRYCETGVLPEGVELKSA